MITAMIFYVWLCRAIWVYMAMYSYLYNNQMNARALFHQSAMVYCVSKLMEISRVF